VGLGAGAAAVGAGLVIYGTLLTNEWLAADLLDTAPPGELEKYRFAPDPNAAAQAPSQASAPRPLGSSLVLLPTLMPDGAGLAAALWF
jgi:hypothetical protein